VSGEVGTATFSSLNPNVTAAVDTTKANWRVVHRYDGKPTNVFPWSRFWTQINPLTLSNVGGRLAAVASESNGAWQVTLFSYDADGRVSVRHTFTEANGGASVLTALNTTTTYVRDRRGELTERRMTVGSSAWNQWYDHDGRGLLWKVFGSTGATKPATPDVTYTYRPSGLPASRQFMGGTTVPVRYTIREQLGMIGDTASTTHRFSAAYRYHANGTVSETQFYNAGTPTGGGATKRYKYAFGTASYDALNRLKSADFSSWSGSAWTSTLAHDLTNITYDPSGNLRSLRRYPETGTLIDRLGYAYPSGSNRLTSVTDTVPPTDEPWDAESGSFTHDANGNVKTSPAPYSLTAATYDHMNLPLSFTRGGTTTVYRYGPDAQRIAKRVGSGNTEVYLREGPLTLAVFTVNGSGVVQSHHFNVVSGQRVVGRRLSAGGRRYYHTDLLGSTRTVTDSLNVVKEAYDYDPWGVLMPGRTLGSGTKEGFTGKERDAETGLDYFGFRYYMPAVGRWTSVDPPADSFPSWSPYNYVEGNPLSNIDPVGLNPILGWVARVAWKVGGPRVANVVMGRLVPAIGSFGRAAIQALQPGPEPTPDVGTGVRVIGKLGEYEDFARQGGHKFFRLSDEIWNSLSDAERWARNQEFLDDAIKAGDEFVVKSQRLYPRGQLPGPGDPLPPGAGVQVERRRITTNSVKPIAAGDSKNEHRPEGACREGVGCGSPEP
jgi:RHS repeat-associated protein